MSYRSPTGKFLAILFFIIRFIILISSPFETIPGYGDYWNFYNQAKLGIPFVDFWTEFPPLFPFISRLIFSLVDGREIAYSYLVAIFISIFQAGCVYLLLRLEELLGQKETSLSRTWIYLIFVAGLFYTWSYFDPIAVFFMLLSIFFILQKKDFPAVFAIVLGILTKWFPILVLPAIWRIRRIGKAFTLTLMVLALIAIAWVGLYLLNPEMTAASLTSQVSKGSWETVWALLDRNLGTGNFTPDIDRLNPDTSLIKTGNPSKIPSWISLLVFGGIGLGLLIKSEDQDNQWIVSFIGLTFVLFFLWSPGYSPQWVLYLLPFILLCLPNNEAYLLAAVLILVNLLEWPVLLSRGNFWSLKYIIPLRTALIILLGIRLYQKSIGKLEIETS